MSANVEIVRRLIEAWSRGDYPAALDSIDPNIEVDAELAVDLSGTHRGRRRLAEMVEAFWRDFEDQRTEIEEIEEVGSDVVVGVRFFGRGKRSGVETEVHLWHVWTVRDGKAVRWQILRTRREAMAIAGAQRS
jgi:ketosteroid isomerase-like protein